MIDFPSIVLNRDYLKESKSIIVVLKQDGRVNDRLVGDFDQAGLANQRRMNADPFDAILMDHGLIMDLGYRVRPNSGARGRNGPSNEDDSSPEVESAVQCRTS
jgi:hypothetical protein